MRPCRHNMCSYESIIDGTLDLADIARMNDALMVDADNQELARERARSEFGK